MMSNLLTPANVRSIYSLQAQSWSARRIARELDVDRATVGYDGVRRLIRRLGASRNLPFRRMECAAGDGARVDFGVAAPLVGPDGRHRRTHAFRIILGHRRMGYSEATSSPTTDDFPRALENSFHFIALHTPLFAGRQRLAGIMLPQRLKNSRATNLLTQITAPGVAGICCRQWAL